MKVGRFALLALLVTLGACNEFEDPPPEAPTVPDIPPSRFDIAGRWDGQSSQGRPIRFDVTSGAEIVEGELALHHNCTGGRLELRLTGYRAEVSGDSFTATLDWRVDEELKHYVGVLTVSGRFEGDVVANGGWVNSITEKQADNLGVCGPASGNWQAGKH